MNKGSPAVTALPVAMDMVGGKSAKRSYAKILGSIEEQIGGENTFYFVHVHKAKGNSEMKVEDPVHVIQLDRRKGARLGLKLVQHPSKKSLLIKEVLSGLASQFNTSAANKDKIRPGDKIVRVNDVEVNCNAMLEECKNKNILELEIHRGSVVALTAGLAVTVKIPYGTFTLGEEGVVMKVDDEGDALLRMPDEAATQWITKVDYDKFMFEGQDTYYLKRFCDLRDMHSNLKQKFINQEPTTITEIPEFPPEETLGFRRQLAAFGMGNFMTERREGLQKVLDELFAQIDKVEDEPAIAQLFANQVPEVEPTKQFTLQQRLEELVMNHHDKVLEGTLALDTQEVLRGKA